MLSDEISLRDHFRDHGFQVTTRKHSLDIRTLLDVWMGDTNRNIQQDDGLDIRTLLGTWRGDAIWFIQQESQLGHQDCTGDMDGRYKLDNTTGQLGHQDFNGDMDGGYNMVHTTGITTWTSGLYWGHGGAIQYRSYNMRHSLDIRTLLKTWMGDTNRIIQQETQPGSGLYWRHGWDDSSDIRNLLKTWMGDTNRIIQQETQPGHQVSTGDTDGRYKQDHTIGQQLGHQASTGDTDGRYKQDHTTGNTASRTSGSTEDMDGRYKQDHTIGQQLGHQASTGDTDGRYKQDHTTGNTACIRPLLKTWMGDSNRIVQHDDSSDIRIYWRHGWAIQTGSYNRAARISGFYWRHGWAIQHRSYKSKHSLGIRTLLETWMGDANGITE
ncbi:MAG: hypothetical protein J3Q66DRAFT_395886 [Benniella sp.]|nr:MAG: hypothetical protein J3Q66DRAFT_395886 [Benniella sp.]